MLVERRLGRFEEELDAGAPSVIRGHWGVEAEDIGTIVEEGGGVGWGVLEEGSDGFMVEVTAQLGSRDEFGHGIDLACPPFIVRRRL